MCAFVNLVMNLEYDDTMISRNDDDANLEVIIRSRANLVEYNDIVICESRSDYETYANLVEYYETYANLEGPCANLVRLVEIFCVPLTTSRPCAKLAHAKITRSPRI